MVIKKKTDIQPVTKLVEHLFRHHSARLRSVLVRIFGFPAIDDIDDIIQETLISALEKWSLAGIPPNPEAWMTMVAKNKVIDRLRHKKIKLDSAEDYINHIENSMLETKQNSITFKNEINDDIIAMMIACCHPKLSKDSQISLILKTVCSFSVAEISAVFVIKETTVAQRIVRAKRTIKSNQPDLNISTMRKTDNRIDTVLKVFYLMFNEGYSAHSGNDIIRYDLINESIRLTEILNNHPLGNQPKVKALLALFCFHTARFPARTDINNDLMQLKDQNRFLWNKKLIAQGFTYLDESASGSDMSTYHLEAAIAGCHVAAKRYEETPWQKIIDYYDMLIKINDSPIILLNRAVAVGEAKGPQAGLHELKQLPSQSLKEYYLYYAAQAEMYIKLKQYTAAARLLNKAIPLTHSNHEKRHLRKKIAECNQA